MKKQSQKTISLVQVRDLEGHSLPLEHVLRVSTNLVQFIKESPVNAVGRVLMDNQFIENVPKLTTEMKHVVIDIIASEKEFDEITLRQYCETILKLETLHYLLQEHPQTKEDLQKLFE